MNADKTQSLRFTDLTSDNQNILIDISGSDFGHLITDVNKDGFLNIVSTNIDTIRKNCVTWLSTYHNGTFQGTPPVTGTHGILISLEGRTQAYICDNGTFYRHRDNYGDTWGFWVGDSCLYFDNESLLDYDATHYYYDFTPKSSGYYMIITNFRPINATSDCVVKLETTTADPIGGAQNVGKYFFESFPTLTTYFTGNQTKRIFFNVNKDSNPTIRCNIVRVSS